MSTACLTHKRFSEHDYPRHPEHKGRIEAVWRELRQQGLAEQLVNLTPAPATDEQILAVHKAGHLEQLKRIAAQDRLEFIDADTYAAPGSLEVARLAAGAAIGAVDAVVSGEADNALALVRPPGHHATPARPMGFCLLNNIAIAGRHAKAQHGIERLAIFDYDVHHGNGTQDIFYGEGAVMFVSIHQSPFYPGSGGLNETGAGAGRGATINVPIAGGHGDGDYQRIMADVVGPAVANFSPELLLVSVGFDAHWMDPLANMQLSLAGYDQLARACLRLSRDACDGRVVFVMEGGYDLPALAHGWCNVARACLGHDEISDPYGLPRAAASSHDIDSTIDAVRRIHRL